MFKQILVPLDGSPLAERALATARELAVQFNSEITLCRVIDMGDYAATAVSSAYFELHRVAVENAESYLATLKQSLRNEGVITNTRLFDHGIPADCIINMAKNNDFDLIVMTTHGRSGLQRWLLGSVTERVVRHTDIPVLLVRPTTEMPASTQLDEIEVEILEDEEDTPVLYRCGMEM